jgi:hypothetical protein
MTIQYWKLDELKEEAIPCERDEWSSLVGTEAFLLWQTIIGPVKVSTIFVGFDLSSGVEGRMPQLFETMVFGDSDVDIQRRYPIYELALAGHVETVTEMRERYDGEPERQDP